MEDRQPITQRVVRAVASQTESDPLELPPLGRAVDVDALDKVEEISGETTVQFDYAGHTITVHDDETIDLLRSSDHGVQA
ncbi:HalOD1 output domain-containing protein [Halomicrobium urmianum]|uniref:HalOD1 output domain-containing protein n=1 Tax=Halomicrobium urmianum TaxID=1586233 RepID=UPI001CD91FC4|nr:HalOD1 output domain-containing protein [Halomicrobium urmianum]